MTFTDRFSRALGLLCNALAIICEQRLQPNRDVVKPRGLIVVQSIDSAWKTGPSSDWSVIATIATDLVDFYIVDIWRQREQYPDLRRSAIHLYDMFQPRMIYVEEATSGLAVVQELRLTANL